MKLVKSIKKTTKTPAPRSAAAKNRVNGAPRAATTPNLTTIEARIDVGFGNGLFLRGQGDGLSWERGVPLTCVDGRTWQWSGPIAEKLTFKLLLNDAVWSQGEDIVAAPGQKLDVVPTF
jgi:hypothetical protein